MIAAGCVRVWGTAICRDPGRRLDAERFDGGLDRIRAGCRRAGRCGIAVAAAATTFGLTGCSPELAAQWGRAGLPEAASDRASHVGTLWVNTWIAALAIGVLVWGLILWAVIRYRKRGD